MDKDRLKGTANKAEGSVKQALGKLSGNAALEAEGKIKKAEGTLQAKFGKAKDAPRKH